MRRTAMTSRQPTLTSLAVSHSVAWNSRRHCCLGCGFVAPESAWTTGTSSTPTADRCSVSRCLLRVKKFLNDPFAVVDEMIDGLEAALRRPNRAHRIAPPACSSSAEPGTTCRCHHGRRIGRRASILLRLGWTWIRDRACLGNIFAEPVGRADSRARRTAATAAMASVRLRNYEGDVIEFEMALPEVLRRWHPHASHTCVSTILPLIRQARRNSMRDCAGRRVYLKVAGARADQGATLDDVYLSAEKANDCTRTVSVAPVRARCPPGNANFRVLPEGMMDVGMGADGEAGIPESACDGRRDRRRVARLNTVRVRPSTRPRPHQHARRHSAE